MDGRPVSKKAREAFTPAPGSVADLDDGTPKEPVVYETPELEQFHKWETVEPPRKATPPPKEEKEEEEEAEAEQPSGVLGARDKPISFSLSGGNSGQDIKIVKKSTGKGMTIAEQRKVEAPLVFEDKETPALRIKSSDGDAVTFVAKKPNPGSIRQRPRKAF